MNRVYLALEIDYDHHLTLGAYDTFEKAENACKEYAKNSDITYGDYFVQGIPMNAPATQKAVYWNDDREFVEVKE